jgi:hypothetical protein
VPHLPVTRRWVTVTHDHTVGELRSGLARPDHAYAVLTDGHAIHALLTAEDLAGAADDEPVSSLAPTAPVVVAVALLLEQTGAAGALLIDGDDDLAGVIPAAAIADAVSIQFTWENRSAGRPLVPGRAYVCRKCVPPTHRVPRVGPNSPVCPRDLLHGPMERLDV